MAYISFIRTGNLILIGVIIAGSTVQVLTTLIFGVIGEVADMYKTYIGAPGVTRRVVKVW